MDDYGWDSGGETSGMDLGLNYDTGGSSPEPSYLSNLDYSQGGGGSFNPDEYLASQGGYTPPQEPGGALSKMGDAFMQHFKANPMQVLAQLAGAGTGLYSTMQGMKQRNELARQMKDAKAAREAKLAQYGSVLPMRMDRTMLAPQGDLLTAGQRPGGVNWFTPAKFTTGMAEGGAVKPSWVDSLFARKPAPAVVGTGTASRAGEAIQDRGYQLYKQTQEMNDAIPLPYETWVQLQQQGRGMAGGGAVEPSWLDSLFARKPAPAVVGTGAASKAGEAIQDRGYQLYKQTQEMNDAIPLPYETWTQLQQQGRGKAAGGALSRMVRGPGDGTSDSVPINAADGEYVFSAQDVSDLGNGSNEAGARKLDEMRQRLRAHKKRASQLAPDAKSPEAYMKGGK